MRRSYREKINLFIKRPFVKRILIVLVSILGLLLLMLIVGYNYVASKVPSEETLKNIENHTASEVYSADSVLLGKYFIYERSNVRYSEISPDLIKALVATEDVRYYEHTGVDGIGLLRVLVKSILLRNESAGGGSTLSQQLAKNVFPRKKHKFFSMPINKLREAIIARKLEKLFTKEELLTLYLNTVPFGDNAYGIKIAARRYFNKTPAQLSLQESAVLVGMLKANTTYNPRKYPDRSKARRNVVLEQMHKNAYLTRAEADSIKALPLILNYTVDNHHEGLAPYFREHLRQELLTWCTTHPKADGTEYNLYTDGLKIYTTIDSRMQRYAEEAVREHLSALQRLFFEHWKGQNPWGKNQEVVTDAMKRSDHYKLLKEQGVSDKKIAEVFNKAVNMKIFTWSGDKEVNMSPLDSIKYYQHFLQAGLLAMSPENGYVKAWVGGIDHEYFQYDHVNVKTKRQAGSTFKPIVYASALKQGIAPCERFMDEKKRYEEFDGWSPSNAEHQYGGSYSMEAALTKSINTIAVDLIVRSGIDNTIQLANKMGVSSKLDPIPSIALGSADVSLTEMVNAYSVFANRGLLNAPVYLVRITDKNGKEIFRHQQQKPKQVLDREDADIITHMLQTAVNQGTGSSLRSVYGFQRAIAGKTGTTQSQADGWFIGYTPDLVAGVWVGAEDRRVHFRSLALGKGAATALPVWAKFMSKVDKDPELKKQRTWRFPPLSEQALNKLDCPSYEEPKQNVWEKLFGKKEKEAKKDKGDKKEKSKKGLWGIFRKKNNE